ncbi:extracellular solute-binding protein [Spirulina sp. 06S082]|uniref:extracellular solute-binding protein n=1 Tax=Spirulina sp. 06S082 TaxID=3110248 RepID=UPI002B22140F|nr:extracellular solute-binding protein [Spirulina sp. 06S082]MEA5468930.1 extracellular solute-binding protein [Spirulina sp. 06S082]
MLDRRSFLLGSGAILLAGCSDRTREALKVQLLNGSIPRQLIGEFRSTSASGQPAKFTPIAQLADNFKLLQDWQQIAKGEKSISRFPKWVPFVGNRIPPSANLVTLGDTWLAEAIRDRLIQPLKPSQLKGWQNLPESFTQVVTRNKAGFVDKKGEVWGAPYRWGTTVIAYNHEVFKNLDWTPQDWEDLWREELHDRISIIQQPREIIGLTLKKLGHSYNTKDLKAITNLRSELEALVKQIKFYSSTNYLQPLILKDTWVAVGWSTDILPTIKHYPQLKVVVPKSGTSLWCDLWVKPESTNNNNNNNTISLLSDRWIDFCWQDRSAQKISLFSDAVSPMLLKAKRSDLPQPLQENSPRFPDRAIIDKSEFIEPLPQPVLAQYQELFAELKI